MQKHTDGYVTQFPYTYGYFSGLNPLRARIQFLEKGLPFPVMHNACELGYGLGVSINIHAAASSCLWQGADFNPDQAVFAQALANASGANAALYAESFADFCSRPDLPQFDFIGMHGIWSWVNARNKNLIIDFLRKHLAPGGILYISYNTIPGWNAMRPLRDLMSLYMECSPVPDMKENIRNSLAFARRFLDVESRFSSSNPALKNILAEMSGQDAAYLAHEYFNKDWDCASYAEMHSWLGKAGLHYVCQPAYVESVDMLNLSDEQMGFLQNVGNPVLRESLIDFFQERKFRRDYWIRGKRELSYVELCEELFSMSFILVCPVEQASLKAVGAVREADLNEKIFAPLLDAFADGKPHSLLDIIKTEGTNLEFRQILHFVNILCSNEHMAPVQEYDDTIVKKCSRLNTFMEGFAITGEKLTHLASPLLGGGVKTSRMEQIFLLARENNCRTANDMAIFARQQISSSKKLPGAQNHDPVPELDELLSMAENFIKNRLPLLARLKVCSNEE